MGGDVHICAPLLSIAQQASQRQVLINELPNVDDSVRHEAASAATGSQLLHRVALLSRALSTCLPATPGSVVVIVAQSSAAVMEAMLAVLDAGCILCPVNWRWTAVELSQALARLSPSLILFDTHCLELLSRALSTPHVTTLADSRQVATHSAFQSWIPSQRLHLCLVNHWQQQPSSSPPATHTLPQHHAGLTTAQLLSAMLDPVCPAHLELQPQELQLLTSPCGTALLVFTSGTTAAPKAVCLSHAAFHSQSLVKLALVGYSPADTYLHTAPLFHIGGLSSAFAALMAGCTQLFLPRFEPAAVLQAIMRHAVTAFIAVPTILQDLVAAAGSAAPAVAPVHSSSSAEGLLPVTGGSDGACGSAGGQGLGPGQGRGRGRDLRCVRRILVGAGSTSPRLQAAVSRTFPCVELISAYGMTEACSSMTFRHLHHPTRALPSPSSSFPAVTAPSKAQMWALPGNTVSGSRSCIGRRVQGPTGAEDPVEGAAGGLHGAVCVGWPAPGVQILIRPSEELAMGAAQAAAAGSRLPANGTDVVVGCGPYMVGEVLTRGPHVMLGYWRDHEATAEVLSLDGWLRTGDLGYLAADGALWLVGRAKEMIKSGGENVFAPQVEAALCSHPAVVAAAVVGLPDERLGEQVAALVVLREGWAFDGPMLTQPLLPAPPAPSGAWPTTQGDEVGAATLAAASAGTCVADRDGRRTSLSALQAHCRTQGLAGFRLPRFAASQRQPLPCTSSGKVHKAAVRQALAALRSGAAAEAQEPRGSADVVALSRL